MLADSHRHCYFHIKCTACELSLWPQLRDHFTRWTIVTFTALHIIRKIYRADNLCSCDSTKWILQRLHLTPWCFSWPGDKYECFTHISIRSDEQGAVKLSVASFICDHYFQMPIKAIMQSDCIDQHLNFTLIITYRVDRCSNAAMQQRRHYWSHGEQVAFYKWLSNRYFILTQ